MRQFTSYSEHDTAAKELVNLLPRLKGDVFAYRTTMQRLGKHLAEGILSKLSKHSSQDICVICAVEDADFLAKGLLDELTAKGLGERTRLFCLWTSRLEQDAVSIAPVLRSYEEKFDHNQAIFVIVKSIISGACVVKTNIIHAVSMAVPARIFVAAPVMLEGAEARLSREFSSDISGKFEFVHFATDDQVGPDGHEVIPGIGGSVYELLGLGDKNRKNTIVPNIVKERRRRLFPAPTPEPAAASTLKKPRRTGPR
jgi:hypothetical protein